MYTQTNRFRRDYNFSGSRTDRNENARSQTQKVWTHGYRKQRRKDKPARRFTAGRRRNNHNGDNNNNSNITSLHDITLKIRKLYDDIANNFNTTVVTNNSSLPVPFKPINYKRIHKRWKNKKFKQQVGGEPDCLDSTRPKSVTVMEDPDGSGTFIVENNSTDRNVDGSLDAVAKELMKQPNPPGTTKPAKFPVITPPADPNPDEPDTGIDGSLPLKKYDSNQFKSIYGAKQPHAKPEPANPEPAKPEPAKPQPVPIIIDPMVKKQQILLKAVTAIAIIGAAGATVKLKPLDGEAAETEAEKRRNLQKRLALVVAATCIAGLGALGATEDTDTKTRLEKEEAEREKIRKENEEIAKRNYKFLTAVAAIAGIAAAGAIEGHEAEPSKVAEPEPAPAPAPPEPSTPMTPPPPKKNEDLPWDSLYMKWMQVTENKIYEKELTFNALTDSDADVTAGDTDDVKFTRNDVKTALGAFAKIDDGKMTFIFNSTQFPTKYNKENVFRKLNEWVTKWKEFGGAIRTFIAFKTSADEQAGVGDPYKITTADLLAEKVILPKIPNITKEVIANIYGKFVTWMNTPGDDTKYEEIKTEFENNNIVIDTKQNITDAVINDGGDTKFKKQFKQRFQIIYLCKLILLHILKPAVLDELYVGDSELTSAVSALDSENPKTKQIIIDVLIRISDSQFNEMYVHYNPTFVNSDKKEKPILPKILLDAFPYTPDASTAAAAAAAASAATAATAVPAPAVAPPEDLKDVLYGKFYSVWDSSVIGNKARYENGKFNSLRKVIQSGGNVVLFGYGYSGSGKTYTLTNEDAVNKDDWGIGPKIVNDMIAAGYTYKATVDELYSKDITFNRTSGFGFGSTQLKDILTSSKKTKINYDGVTAEGNNINDLISMFKRVKYTRLKEGRIKATINNPESSRGHLFYNIEFEASNKEKGKLVICDMGGRENPLEMAKNTFIVLTGQYIGQLAQYKGYANGKHKFDVWKPKITEKGLKNGFINDNISLLLDEDSERYIVPIMRDAFEIYPFKENPQSFISDNISLISAFGTIDIDSEKTIEHFVSKHKNDVLLTKMGVPGLNKPVQEYLYKTIIDFFTACKEGFFINETINHLTSYVNYLSMMDESLSGIELLDTAITTGDQKTIKTANEDEYKPTKMIQDPRRIILDLEQKKYQNPINTQPYSICNLHSATTKPQDDYFGLITKLFELKRPASPELSIICVMACIRTSHEKSSDNYRAATGKTLNFAISVSASNPAVRDKVAPVQINMDAGVDKGEYKPPINAPQSYTPGAIANFIINLGSNKLRVPDFQDIQERQAVISGKPDINDQKKYYTKSNITKDKHIDLLNRFWNVYKEWMDRTKKPSEQTITKDTVESELRKKLNVDPNWKGGAKRETRRKRKSGGNKKTRRIP